MQVVVWIIIVLALLALLGWLAARSRRGDATPPPGVSEQPMTPGSARKRAAGAPPSDVSRLGSVESPIPPEPARVENPDPPSESAAMSDSGGHDRGGSRPVPVRADPDSGLYHTPESPEYRHHDAGVVYESEDAARTAGFTRWDQPR